MRDNFKTHYAHLESPAENFFAIVPSNSVDFDYAVRAIYVGGDGNIAIVAMDGTAVTFNGVKAGTIIPVRARRVNVANTTASNLVGLY